MKKRLLCTALALLMLLTCFVGSAVPTAQAINTDPSIAIWVNGSWVAAKSLSGLSGEQWLTLPISASVLKDSGEGSGATNYVRLTSNVANGSTDDTRVQVYGTTGSTSTTYISHNWWVDSDWSCLSTVNAEYTIEGWNGAQWVVIHNDTDFTSDTKLTVGCVSSSDYQGYARNLWTVSGTLANYANFRVRVHLYIGSNLTVASGNIQNLFPASNYLSCAYCETCGGCTYGGCTLSHVPCSCGSTPEEKGSPSVAVYVNGKWISAVSVGDKTGETWLEFPINADALRDSGEGSGAVNYVRIAAKCCNGSTLSSHLQMLFTPSDASNTYVSHNWWADSDWTLLEGKNADLLIEGWNGSSWERIHSDTNAYQGTMSLQLGKQSSGEYQSFVRNLWVSNGTLQNYTNFRVRAHFNIGTCLTEDTGEVTALFPAENYRSCVFCEACGGCKAENCTLQHVLCGCGEEEPQIISAALRLNRNIDMLYTVQLPEGFTNPSLTVNGTCLTDYTQQEDGTLRFTYMGITPQCMCDTLAAELSAEKDGETYTCRMENYSVRTYCENLLTSDYCEADATLRVLLSDLLTYGAASQHYENYATDTLADADIDLTPSSFSALSDQAAAFSGTSDLQTDWVSATLLLGNDLTFRFTFFAESVKDLSVRFSFADREETVTEFVSCGNNRYTVCFSGVSATEYDCPVTATFYRSGVAVSRSIQYSVNTYVSVKQNDASELTKNLVRALYCYGASAVKYETYHPYAETPVDMTPNTLQPVGKREDACSLNGTWELAPDFLASKTETILGSESSVIKNSLCGRTLGMTLTVSTPDANAYISAKAYLLAEKDLQTTDGGSFTIYTRVNQGDWIPTECALYANGWNHWVSLSVAASDLQEGTNTIEIKSNAASGAWLYGTLQSGAVGYQVSGGKTASTGMNYLLGFCTFTCPTTWNSATVPAAAEQDLKLPYTGSVYPDTYDGVVWYRKTFTYTPEEGQQWLCFNAVDYQAEVWLNGEYLGSHEGGYTGFEFCVTNWLKAGENTLVVRVTDQNRSEDATEDTYPIKETLAGFSQDSRGMNYCGIWQSVYLEARGYVAIDEIYVQTGTSPTAEITLYNPGEASVQTMLTVSVPALHLSQTKTVTVPAGKSTHTFSLDLSGAEEWSPEHPTLYDVSVSAFCEAGTDTMTDTFGISRMTVNGNQFIHNGEAVFLTGMLHWGSYYENYTSAISETRVRYEISQLQAAGFNAIKYCLTCPPDYILDICDEMGMFVYIEYPVWNVSQTQSFFERAYLQIPELIKTGRTHPCVVMSDFDCEDHGFTDDMAVFLQWCIAQGKELDSKRVYTDNSGNEAHSYGDYATLHPYYQVGAYRDALKNIVANSNGQPVVLGEFDDVAVLRDIQELNSQSTSDYTWYHTYFGEIDHGTLFRSSGWTEAAVEAAIENSHSNAQELMKYFIETAKAQEGIGALFLTQMTESPNGWADGFLSDLYTPNYEASVLRKAARNVSLLLPLDSVNFYQEKTYTLTPKISLYGGYDLTDATLSYEISSGDTVIASGTAAEHISLKNGGLYAPGTVSVTFPSTETAEALTCKLTLTQGGKTLAANSWSLWSYPTNRLAQTAARQTIRYYDPTGTLTYDWTSNGILPYTAGAEAALVITTAWTEDIESYLRAGGKVLYAGAASGVLSSVYTTDYDRYSFAYAPIRSNRVAASLQTGGWGGLQFADLATPYYLNEQSGFETLLGRINITGGTWGSYVSAGTVSSGVLVQTTFRLGRESVDCGYDFERLTVSGENAVGSYLLEQLALYTLSCG